MLQHPDRTLQNAGAHEAGGRARDGVVGCCCCSSRTGCRSRSGTRSWGSELRLGSQTGVAAAGQVAAARRKLGSGSQDAAAASAQDAAAASAQGDAAVAAWDAAAGAGKRAAAHRKAESWGSGSRRGHRKLPQQSVRLLQQALRNLGLRSGSSFFLFSISLLFETEGAFDQSVQK